MKNFEHFGANDYLRIFWRRRWYFLLTSALITGAVGVYVWRLPPIYKSVTTILVEPQIVPEDYIRSSVKSTSEDLINMIQQQIYSRTFLERMVLEFGFNRGSGGELLLMEDVVAGFGKSIEIIIPSPNTFSLSYSAGDRYLARNVTKRLAETLIEMNTESSHTKAIEADQFVDEQLRQCQRELAAAEEKLKEFRIAHGGELPEESTANRTAVETLRSQLSSSESSLQEAVERRKRLGSRLSEQQRRLRLLPRNLPSANTVPKSPPKERAEITALAQQLSDKKKLHGDMLAKYTERYPDVLALAQEIRDLERQLGQLKREDDAKAGAERSAFALSAGSEEPPGKDAKPPVESVATDGALDLEIAETKTEMESIDRVIARREKENAELLKQIVLYQSRVKVAPGLQKEFLDLTRKQEVLQQQCGYLQGIKFNAQMTTSLETKKKNHTFKIIDAANLPERPELRGRQKIALLGLAGGLFLGLVIAATREYFDATLSTEEQAGAELNLPILVAIAPISPNSGRRKRSKHIKRARQTLLDLSSHSSASDSEKPQARKHEPDLFVELPTTARLASFFASSFDIKLADELLKKVLEQQTIAREQYRMLGARLSLMREQRGFKTLLITSAVASEGKTLTGCCLAGILAEEADKRVLLIDADLRKGSAARILGLNGKDQVGGLCQVLRGEARLEDKLLCATNTRTFASTGMINLYFLPAGQPPLNAAELLSTVNLGHTLKRVSDLFDWVIIDSPPIVSTADATLLASKCDAAVLVVRANKTSAKLIKSSIQRVGENRICGVVMNCLQNRAFSRYYNRYYSDRD